MGYAACLLERHARPGTARATLIARILDLLAGPGGDGGMASPVSGGSWGVAPRLTEQLSGSEIRVLRYLPTHL